MVELVRESSTTWTFGCWLLVVSFFLLRPGQFSHKTPPTIGRRPLQKKRHHRFGMLVKDKCSDGSMKCNSFPFRKLCKKDHHRSYSIVISNKFMCLWFVSGTKLTFDSRSSCWLFVSSFFLLGPGQFSHRPPPSVVGPYTRKDIIDLGC